MPKQVSSKEYLRTVNTFYYMQMFVIMAFGGVALFLVQNGNAGEGNPSLAATLQTVLIVEFAVSIIGGYFLFRYMIKKIDSTFPLRKKMPKYFAAVLLRSTLFEIPALLAAVVAFISVDITYLAVIPIVFIIFYLLRPTTDIIAQDLDLGRDDHASLGNPEAIIAETD
ncbi:MAG TPA: hypothetical protein VFE57_01940 [Cyclobacteriaceae bacterium]|nr:hypothetical protein [Cyclobacteriaceae bacterium]